MVVNVWESQGIFGHEWARMGMFWHEKAGLGTNGNDRARMGTNGHVWVWFGQLSTGGLRRDYEGTRGDPLRDSS